MSIASGIICGWPDTDASIPSGWVRNVFWDARYLIGAEIGGDAGATGGVATHGHSSPSHTPLALTHHHTFRAPSGSGGTSGNLTGSPLVPSHPNHGHTSAASGTILTVNSGIAITVDTSSNDLQFTDVLWIESNGTPTGFPDGSIIWIDDDAIQTGWTRVNGNGYFKSPVFGTGGGGTGGSNTHTHTSPGHTHSGGGNHVHADPISSPSIEQGTLNDVGVGPSSKAARGHTHNLNTGNGTATNQPVTTIIDAASNEPTNLTLNSIQNGLGWDDLEPGMIAAWSGTDAGVPTDWTRETAADDRFIKSANADGEVGNTGGAVSHSHTASSCLPIHNLHSHSVGDSGPSTTISVSSGGGSSWASGNHSHTSWDTQLKPVNLSATVTIDTSTPDETATFPPWVRAIFIKYTPTIPAFPAKAQFNRHFNGCSGGGFN